MHKGVILLVKAEDRNDAINRAEEFLQPYEGQVWDWYSIGGRWHNVLAPKDKVKEFKEWVKETFSDAFVDESWSYIPNKLETPERREIIQNKWEELGLTGKNSYYSSFGFEVNDTKDDYNVQPLSQCLDVVKDWKLNRKKKAEEIWEEMLEAKANEGKSNKFGHMSGYCAGIYKSLVYGEFSFECNIYNVENELSEDLPDEDENIEDYWAVMVDMHN